MNFYLLTSSKVKFYLGTSSKWIFTLWRQSLSWACRHCRQKSATASCTRTSLLESCFWKKQDRFQICFKTGAMKWFATPLNCVIKSNMSLCTVVWFIIAEEWAFLFTLYQCMYFTLQDLLISLLLLFKLRRGEICVANFLPPGEWCKSG